MTWRAAKSLLKLREQINAKYPGRSIASDGMIGDPNHQAEGTGSDHNPNKLGVVCAFDITHDPAHNLYIDELADSLAKSRDSRIKYMIRNSAILIPAAYGWQWVTYTGDNPHTSHLHLSVHGDYDNTNEWNTGEETMTEDGVRFGILGVTGNKPLVAPNDYEKEVKYWTGRDPQEFCKYLYGLGDAYMGLARQEITDLKKQLKAKSVPATSSDADKKLSALSTAIKDVLDIK